MGLRLRWMIPRLWPNVPSGRGTAGNSALCAYSSPSSAWSAIGPASSIGSRPPRSANRRFELTQLTRDHSLLQLLIDEGRISQEDARSHPAANQLTRYVGMPGEVLPDAQIVELRPKDRLLLCTDGLANMLDVAALEEILSGQDDPQQACQALIHHANATGGRDNVTALVIAG